MEFTDVRNMIDSTITENGKNEITGLALNAALTEIVDVVEEALDIIDPDAISTQIDSKVATSVAEAKTEITTATNESISTLSNEIDVRITELENRPVDPGIITFWGLEQPTLAQPHTLEEVNALLEETPDDPELLYLQRIIPLNIDSYNDIITNGLKQFIIKDGYTNRGYVLTQMAFIYDTVIMFVIFMPDGNGQIVCGEGSILPDGRITYNELTNSSPTE